MGVNLTGRLWGIDCAVSLGAIYARQMACGMERKMRAATLSIAVRWSHCYHKPEMY